jgi:putative aldouronate transport system permease protein
MKEIYKHRVLYLFLLPCIVSYFIFSYLPMGGLVLAFKEFRFDMGIFQSPWVGFRFFERYFNYHKAWLLIRNTLALGFLKIVLEFPFPVLFAILINEIKNLHFKKITQTVSYLPYFISMIVVVGMTKQILAPDVGMLNFILTQVTGARVRTNYIMQPEAFYPIIFFIDMWKGLGWGSIIYLAAITNIDPELYEAAKIDGANKLKLIWNITLPGMRSTMGILFIMGLGGIISTGFEQPYLLKTPGNAVFADILDLYVIEVGLRDGQYGYATAVGLMQGLVGLIMVVTANQVSKKFTEISVW